MSKFKWRRTTGWLVLALAILCAALLFLLVAGTALDKETGAWAKASLLLIGATAAVAALVVGNDEAWKAKRTGAWLQPRPLAGLFVAIFAAFGVMTDALSLFEPRPAVESEPGTIERGVEQISGDVRQILAKTAPHPVAPARIAQVLPGLWGEPGCGVAYRFSIREQAVIVDAERRPAGAPAYRLVATITSARGDVLEVRGEEPRSARGKAATFTFATNGATERLTWDDQASEVPLELDRCE
ncbi:MAG TPA: hypothetical protein VFZ91_02600 [Allosphingosinicella sp.]